MNILFAAGLTESHYESHLLILNIITLVSMAMWEQDSDNRNLYKQCNNIVLYEYVTIITTVCCLVVRLRLWLVLVLRCYAPAFV